MQKVSFVSIAAAAVVAMCLSTSVAEAGPWGNQNNQGWTGKQRVLKSTQLLSQQLVDLCAHLTGKAFYKAEQLGNKVANLRQAIKQGRPAFALRNRHQRVLRKYRQLRNSIQGPLWGPAKQSMRRTRKLVTRLNCNMRVRRISKIAQHMAWRAENFAQAVGQQGGTSFLESDAQILRLDVETLAQDANQKIGFGIAFSDFKDLRASYCGTEEQAHYALAGSYNWNAKHSARKLQRSYAMLHRALLGFGPENAKGQFKGCGTHNFY